MLRQPLQGLNVNVFDTWWRILNHDSYVKPPKSKLVTKHLLEDDILDWGLEKPVITAVQCRFEILCPSLLWFDHTSPEIQTVVWQITARSPLYYVIPNMLTHQAEEESTTEFGVKVSQQHDPARLGGIVNNTTLFTISPNKKVSMIL